LADLKKLFCLICSLPLTTVVQLTGRPIVSLFDFFGIGQSDSRGFFVAHGGTENTKNWFLFFNAKQAKIRNTRNLITKSVRLGLVF
jgi:hypothetical protein